MLRLPDITHSVYSKKKELREVVRWAVTFAEQSGFYDDNHKKLMSLVILCQWLAEIIDQQSCWCPVTYTKHLLVSYGMNCFDASECRFISRF